MRWPVTVIGGLLFLVVASGAWAQARPPMARVEVAPVRMPVLGDLRGKTCDAARAELRKLDAGLETCPTGRSTGDYPPGTINAQSLKPGTPASQLGGLRVTLEPPPAPTPTPTRDPSPAPTAALPDFRGKTCDQARAELQRLKVALTDCRPGQSRQRYPPGTINAQSYAPGTPVSRVDGLRVTVEPGPAPAPESTAEPAAPVSVDPGGVSAAAAALAAIIANAKIPALPDLRGKTCEQAKAELLRLRVELKECVPGPAGSTYKAGTISSQSQPAGIAVSLVKDLRARFEPLPAAPEPRLTLPDLRGKTCDQAARQLAGLRLKAASCTDGEALAHVPPGRINAQSPNPGAVLPLSVAIVLRVQPAPMVIVPALIGLGEAQASRALSGVGLQSRTSGPAAAQGRRVLSQNPSAGTPVGPGSAVQVGLGLGIPRLLGLDCAAARARAAEYGHTQVECESRPAPSTGETLGRVFEQTPPAGGAAIPAPATVRVAVWVAQPVTVPDVRERALDEAIGSIETARLVPQPDQRQGERVVVQQSPAPGTVVDAGSAVKLETREVVEVPDVVGHTLAAAQSQLRQSRLRDAADAQDHADDRTVQSQAPAAHARLAADSAVQLSTKRFATVPDLGGKTCDEARAVVAPDTFGLSCNDEDSWRVTAFGTPHVVAQQPGARARAEVGATIVAEARAPVPAAAPWLGKVPLAAVAGVVVAPFLGLGLWLAWPRSVPLPVPPPVAPEGLPPVTLPIVPPLVPPRAPTFEWRVDADNSPAVSLRWPSAGKAAEHVSRPAAPAMAWRVVPDAGHVLLRGVDVVSSGGDHAKH